ncbi:hypothetical protein CEXT_437481 [Caerostris extrusa]|uniref:Uncharacterized protein n=1 Tax=Caerostris extrusa TaxID=172846 RepID=A0AAV4XU91_CAEEX|nr:hypothetical protein CEXT_437481 [Caerostris extrusa]
MADQINLHHGIKRVSVERKKNGCMFASGKQLFVIVSKRDRKQKNLMELEVVTFYVFICSCKQCNRILGKVLGDGGKGIEESPLNIFAHR